jgi:hypothetical protein
VSADSATSARRPTRFDEPNDGDKRMNENEEDVAHGWHRIKISKNPEFRLILEFATDGRSTRARGVRDFEELWNVLKDSVRAADIPTWLRSANDAFDGRRPIDL